MRRGIASLICFFAHCESSVDWRRLTGRHPAPHTYCITLSKGLPFRWAFSLGKKKARMVSCRQGSYI
nr:MAG TPA: hypothetical protein [Caudoviricetes sp.]